MLTVIRLLLLRWLAARTLGGVVAGMLGVALPIAVLLKFVGLPLLAVVALVGAPVGGVLGVLRLPIRIVLGVVSFVGGLVAAAFADRDVRAQARAARGRRMARRSTGTAPPQASHRPGRNGAGRVTGAV